MYIYSSIRAIYVSYVGTFVLYTAYAQLCLQKWLVTHWVLKHIGKQPNTGYFQLEVCHSAKSPYSSGWRVRIARAAIFVAVLLLWAALWHMHCFHCMHDTTAEEWHEALRQ